MNDIENYIFIIEKVFNKKLNLAISENTNNCIGALNHNDEFITFKTNFIERLKRLYSFYFNKPITINEILKTLKNIGIAKGYKWSGGYSELIALDYLIQYNNLHNIDYQLKDSTTIFNNSIAKIIGQSEIDLDIALDFSSFKVYMDIKSFQPTHIEMSDKIFELLKKRSTKDSYLIGVDEIYDVDYHTVKNDLEYEIKNGSLIDDLEKCILSKETYYSYGLKSGRTLKFRIAYQGRWEDSILYTTRITNPYRLAMNYKYKVLDYYNKIICDKASFLVFVINPWFNNEISDFGNSNETFYRALTRRIFIELKNNIQDMGLFFPDLIGKNLKICDVVSFISGIVFIEDKSITLTGKDIYNTYFYLNPNAKNKIVNIYDFDILKWSNVPNQIRIVEDFVFDNY